MNPSDYQPVVPTALRSLYRFARTGVEAVAMRQTLPRDAMLDSAPIVARMGGAPNLLAEQMAFVLLAAEQERHDGMPQDGPLPECVDVPHPANARQDLKEPTTLDGAALKENLAAARQALDDLAKLWPQAYHSVRSWLEAGSKVHVDSLRAALEPIAGSQSEQAFVPVGAVGFARFLRTRPVFAGSTPIVPPVRRGPRTIAEAIHLAVTGELPDDPNDPQNQTAGGTGDFEFPEPAPAPLP